MNEVAYRAHPDPPGHRPRPARHLSVEAPGSHNPMASAIAHAERRDGRLVGVLDMKGEVRSLSRRTR